MVLIALTAILMLGCDNQFIEEPKESYTLIHNKEGQTLGFSPSSGIQIITVNRYAFKDLNRNEKLDPYEDWRLTFDERARDLASKLSTEQIAGMMLYSRHQAIPADGSLFYVPEGIYGGKLYSEGGAKPYDISDQQKEFLTKDNVRHVLITTVESPEVAARWNNNMQALVEGLGMGVPINISSDPRHGIQAFAEYDAGSGGAISMWPGSLGITASFDPSLMRKFGEVASAEYRALGIATSLSPQIDLATEPRWSRFRGTMGEDPDLATDMARAYVDGFQTSDGAYQESGGWGYRSVNAMVKHWPGGGPEEGGRDGHYGFGAYTVYPGNNLRDHLKPFIDGAFKLEGQTEMASAVMPYYTISYKLDTVNNENVGNAYSTYLINDLLREKYNYDGVVCTDWGVHRDATSVSSLASGKSWGAENLTRVEKHYKILMAGVDQFGGGNDITPVLEAYKMGVEEHGEEFMRKRFEESAVRLLRNIFRVRLFDNPYLDPAESSKVVGNPDFMKAGYEAQLSSVVMLKNATEALPLKKDFKVFIPKKYSPARVDWFGMPVEEAWSDPVNLDVVRKYFEVVDNPAEADAALVFIESPQSGTGYSSEDVEAGGSGYIPISLQYGKYTAESARPTSIAGGSPFESFTNRSYKGKSTTAHNSYALNMVKEAADKMGNKPVILVINTSNPMVLSEVENSCDAILVHFGVQNQALMDLISGMSEPSALLPFQLPADMLTVEEQLEDVPLDMNCYTDSEGNVYDFGFGLNWQGIINDDRVSIYKN